jgi:hypothetical protein
MLAIVAAYVGCGSSSSSGAPGDDSNEGGAQDGGGGTSDDAGTGGQTDAGNGGMTDGAGPSDANGAPSSMYPAFPVDVAQVVNQKGPVLSAPVVVTITWSTDPDVQTYQALGDAIGASTYWSSITSEYGVGPATSGTKNHVNITTAPPASFSDVDLDSFVEANAGKSWPAPTDNTLYAIYLPPGAPLYFGGSPDAGGQDVCAQGVGGYHTESQNKGYVYAIMPHCSMFQAADVEISASHELDEAATDPHPNAHPGWVGFDKDHLSFELFNQFQDEVGDACESFATATDTTDFTPYSVQRQWSNKSAAAGSQWCLPKINEPFYNTTFLASSNLDAINVNLASLGMGLGKVQSKGFKVALNATRTFPIGLFSDMDTGGPFTLDVQGLDKPIAQDPNGNNINNGTAKVTLDKTSGVNGEIANVTVTPTAFSSLGVIFFTVRAGLPNTKQHHYLPVIVSEN